MNICEGEGNTRGPRQTRVCSRCGVSKAETAFRRKGNGHLYKQCQKCRDQRARWEATRIHRQTQADVVATWQKRRQEGRLSPPHMRYAKRGGVGVEGLSGRGRCPECGQQVCYTTNGCGGLLCLEHQGQAQHKHQPPPPDIAANRHRVAYGLSADGYHGG